MPKQVYTGDFVVGWVHARMEQLRKIIHRLENVPDFSLRELMHLRDDILNIDVEVQLQEKMVKDDRIKPKMVEYRALLRRAVVTRERREQRARAIEAGDDRNPPIQFDDVGQQEAARASPSLSTLDIYASDNEEPLPLELMSQIKPAPDYQPIRMPSPEPSNEPQPSTSRQADLREQLEERQQVGSYGVRHENRENSRNNGAQRGRDRERHYGQSRVFVPSRASDRSRSDLRSRAETTTSASSYASYVSTPQEQFSAPVTHRTYPPIRRNPPTPLVRNDPTLIGSSEIFTHPPMGSPKICPMCPLGQHRLWQCTTFLRMGLQEKWYTVLKKGLCVNCLIRGHSHFSCMTPGACPRCGKRHNSKLCPERQENK